MKFLRSLKIEEIIFKLIFFGLYFIFVYVNVNTTQVPVAEMIGQTSLFGVQIAFFLAVANVLVDSIWVWLRPRCGWGKYEFEFGEKLVFTFWFLVAIFNSYLVWRAADMQGKDQFTEMLNFAVYLAIRFIFAGVYLSAN